MDEQVHQYTGTALDVSWDQRRCIHAAACVHGLPSVFDTDERPWVDPDGADADAVADVVMRCPTGALHFARRDGGPAEAIPDRNTVTLATDGPLYLHGDIRLESAAGEDLLSDTRVALCRCGASTNKPLCDGSHVDAGFESAGHVDESAHEPVDDAGDTGELTIRETENGPLLFDGLFELRSSDGTPAQRRDDGAFCRCGDSANKPFCDGTHASVGFTTDSTE